MTSKEWVAEKRNLSKIFSAVTGLDIKIKDVIGNDLGYTAGNDTIYLAEKHNILNGLTDNEKQIFREGVGTHEILHIMLTDFALSTQIIKQYPVHEQRLFGLFLNIGEDPAIEHFAPQVIGGRLLRSLRFSIYHTYRLTPNLEEDKDAFSQYMTSLIQFGDMGLLKGNFTFPEAKETFHKTSSIFLKCIEVPEPHERIKCMQEVFELSKPLWEPIVREEKLMQELLSALAKMGKDNKINGNSRPEKSLEKTDGNSAKDKRRRITIKKVSKEEFEDMKKNEQIEKGPIPEEGDITLLVCDDEKDSDEEKEDDNQESVSIPSDNNEQNTNDKNKDGNQSSISNPSDKEDEDDAKSSSLNQENNDNEEGNDESGYEQSGSSGEMTEEDQELGDGSQGNTNGDDSDNGSSDNSDKSSNSNSSLSDNKTDSNDACDNKESTQAKSRSNNEDIPDNTYSEEARGDYDAEDYEITSEEYEISEKDIESIKNEIDKTISEIESESQLDKENANSEIDFPLTTNKIPGVKCTNNRISITDASSLEPIYDEVVSNMRSGINSMTRQMKRIFRNDIEEYERHTSGNVNFMRLNSSTKSTRVFDKKKSPTDKDDMAVTILVDESGSMGGKKAVAAMQTCIAFAESFYELKIPLYVMGFTTFGSGAGAVHNHYVTWRNTKKERMKLLNIHGDSCNFDSYSIRYGGEILKKKSAKHKLMIIISDGTPSAKNYNEHGINGVTDTKNAIRELKKFSSVLGVAVGVHDSKAIRFMYGEDFIDVHAVEELFIKISNKIKSIVKGW